MPPALWIVQVAIAWFLTGLIWTIQVVHYPLFDGVGSSELARYSARHGTRISVLVMPTMLLELGLASWAVVAPPPGVSAWVVQVGVALVVVIWASTALLQVPAHARLAGGFDASAHARLVGTNWVRTIAWTTRAFVLGTSMMPSSGA